MIARASQLVRQLGSGAGSQMCIIDSASPGIAECGVPVDPLDRDRGQDAVQIGRLSVGGRTVEHSWADGLDRGSDQCSKPGASSLTYTAPAGPGTASAGRPQRLPSARER